MDARRRQTATRPAGEGDRPPVRARRPRQVGAGSSSTHRGGCRRHRRLCAGPGHPGAGADRPAVIGRAEGAGMLEDTPGQEPTTEPTTTAPIDSPVDSPAADAPPAKKAAARKTAAKASSSTAKKTAAAKKTTAKKTAAKKATTTTPGPARPRLPPRGRPEAAPESGARGHGVDHRHHGGARGRTGEEDHLAPAYDQEDDRAARAGRPGRERGGRCGVEPRPCAGPGPGDRRGFADERRGHRRRADLPAPGRHPGPRPAAPCPQAGRARRRRRRRGDDPGHGAGGCRGARGRGDRRHVDHGRRLRVR